MEVHCSFRYNFGAFKRFMGQSTPERFFGIEYPRYLSITEKSAYTHRDVAMPGSPPAVACAQDGGEAEEQRKPAPAAGSATWNKGEFTSRAGLPLSGGAPLGSDD